MDFHGYYCTSSGRENNYATLILIMLSYSDQQDVVFIEWLQKTSSLAYKLHQSLYGLQQ